MKIELELPSDRAVPLAVNRGAPAVLADPGCRLLEGDPRDGEDAIVPPKEREEAAPVPPKPGKGVAMGLHDRLKTAERERTPALDGRHAGPAGADSADARRRPVRRAEDAHPPRVHRAARRRAVQAGDDGGSLRPRLARSHRAADARPDAAHAGRAPPARPRDRRRHPRLRPARAVPARRLRHRGHGQRASTGSTSSARAARAHAARVPRRRPPLRIIDKIVSQVGRRIDEASPMVDARLPDGSRVNAIIPPLALQRADADDPEVLARPVHDRRPDRVRHALRRRPRSSWPPASRAS